MQLSERTAEDTCRRNPLLAPLESREVASMPGYAWLHDLQVRGLERKGVAWRLKTVQQFDTSLHNLAQHSTSHSCSQDFSPSDNSFFVQGILHRHARDMQQKSDSLGR